MTTSVLETGLRVAAAGQWCVAGLNLFLPRLMRWREDLERLPLLAREVFYVHAWFISLTLTIFGMLTWRFAGEMAKGTDEAMAWITAGIAVFWGVRTVIQIGYYSPSHWRGKTGRTIVHVLLLVIYGGLSWLYATTALRG